MRLILESYNSSSPPAHCELRQPACEVCKQPSKCAKIRHDSAHWMSNWMSKFCLPVRKYAQCCFKKEGACSMPLDPHVACFLQTEEEASSLPVLSLAEQRHQAEQTA